MQALSMAAPYLVLLVVSAVVAVRRKAWTQRKAYHFYETGIIPWIVLVGLLGFLRFTQVAQHEAAATLTYETTPLVFLTLGLFLFCKRVGQLETRLFCKSCGKFVQHDSEWMCGYCDSLNSISLYERCRKCGTAPLAYRCHHCQKSIFFGPELTETHVAHKKGPPPIVETEADVERQRGQEKRKKEHDLLIAKLDAQLIQEKARLKQIETDSQPKQSPLLEDYEEHKQHYLMIHEIVAKELAEADAKYKDNEEMRGRFREVIDSWREKHL